MEITIVIPVYNRAKLLPRTLASVVGQTHRPLHVVLVDNGSTDDSMAVLSDFKTRYETPDFRVTVCGASTPGAPAARNEGLRRADTDWVMFFDSDDEMRPHLVENYVTTLECNPEADVIYTDIEITDDAGCCVVKRSPTYSGLRFVYGHIFHTYFSTQRYMVRRSLLDRAGGWNEQMSAGWNDWELGVRLLLQRPRKVKTESRQPQVVVHAHADSITGNIGPDKLAHLQRCMNEAARQIDVSDFGPADKKHMLRCIEYKKVLLAAVFHREGSVVGDKLYKEVVSRLENRRLRLLFAFGYQWACRGLRGSARLVEPLLRFC